MSTSRKDTDWEFDAPKYYDFTKPDGSNDRPDAWFGTGYQSNDSIYRTPTRQSTEPARRIARQEKRNPPELSVAASSNNGRDSQVTLGQQTKRIDIFSALAKRTMVTNAVTSGQKSTATPSQPQLSSVRHQEHVLRIPIVNNDIPLPETKTTQSLLQKLPIRPRGIEKTKPPSKDIAAALASAQKHYIVPSSHDDREEPYPPSSKRPRRGIFEDINKPNAADDSTHQYNTINHWSLDMKRSKNANEVKHIPDYLPETVKENAPNPKPAPERTQSGDNNATEDLMEENNDNMIVDDDVRSLGIVDDAGLDIDEEFSKSVERIAEERIDQSFIRRLSSGDGIIPKPRQSIPSSSSIITAKSPQLKQSAQNVGETAIDGDDDLTRPTDFNAILKKVDSIRSQLAAAAVSTQSDQKTELLTASQNRMQIGYDPDNPRAAKLDSATPSSIDERVVFARRIIDEALKQSRTWFQRKPNSSTSNDLVHR